MKRFRFMTIALCCLAFIMGSVFVYAAETDSRTCHTVAVHGPDSDFIPLANLRINPGDCVIFANNMRPGANTEDSSIKVVYKQGAECQKGVQMSVGFAIDPKMCFASGWLRPLETATMVFSTPGVYDYEILFGKGNPSVLARVTVVKTK
jgi:hypothetical protein